MAASSRSGHALLLLLLLLAAAAAAVLVFASFGELKLRGEPAVLRPPTAPLLRPAPPRTVRRERRGARRRLFALSGGCRSTRRPADAGECSADSPCSRCDGAFRNVSHHDPEGGLEAAREFFGKLQCTSYEVIDPAVGLKAYTFDQ